MSKPTIGIIGGGQLGSMLCSAAKNLNIKTIIISDNKNAPAQFFAAVESILPSCPPPIIPIVGFNI